MAIRLKYIFEKFPLISNCATYCGMCVGAELSQQLLNKRILNPKTPIEEIDVESLKRYAVIGIINPNILYQWYKWLDKKYVGITKKIVLKKVLIDQFLMTPPLYVLFYTSMSIMEKKENILEECKTKFVTTFGTSCIFWLPAQTINFLFIPSSLRVVYVGTCSFIWINILCWLKRK